MKETVTRVKLTPIHSAPTLTRLIVNFNADRFALAKELLESTPEPLFKIKTLKTIFNPTGNKDKVVPENKLKGWFRQLRLLNDPDAPKTLFNSSLKPGEYFRFTGGKKTYVFDGKDKSGVHYHEFDDVNAIHSVRKSEKTIQTDFEF